MKAIFIMGCGRSGTTWLGSMLGSHPRWVVTPESQFKWHRRQLVAVPDAATRMDEQQARELYKFLKNSYRFRIWEVGLDASTFVSENTGRTRREALEALVTAYAQQKHGLAQPEVWIDHTPDNYKYVTPLLCHFPDARFVHIVRDGRAAAASVLPLDWGPGTVLKAADWWLQAVSHCLSAELTFPGQVVRVQYEALTRQPEATLRSLCDALDLPYHADMLLGKGFLTPAYTRSQHQRVGRRADPKRNRSWQQQLTAEDVEAFENMAAGLLDHLGYELQYGYTARDPRKLYLWRQRWQRVVRGIGSWYRRKRRIRRTVTG